MAFFNKSDNIRIQGTLTFPKSRGSFAAVILVPGSRPETRNGSEGDNLKPFYEIAAFLTKNGLAVLRCDKGGAGERSIHRFGFVTAVVQDFLIQETDLLFVSLVHRVLTEMSRGPGSSGLTGLRCKLNEANA